MNHKFLILRLWYYLSRTILSVFRDTKPKQHLCLIITGIEFQLHQWKCGVMHCDTLYVAPLQGPVAPHCKAPALLDVSNLGHNPEAV